MEATALPSLCWRGPFYSAGPCPVTMPLAMHSDMLHHHHAHSAEHALVTVPGVIIAVALSPSLPSAGTDVPTALPVWSLAMHGRWAWPHHRTQQRCCHTWRCPCHLHRPAQICQLPCCWPVMLVRALPNIKPIAVAFVCYILGELSL